jgi:hypothetical protein
MGISLTYLGGAGFQSSRSIGKVTKVISRDNIYVYFQQYSLPEFHDNLSTLRLLLIFLMISENAFSELP